MHIVYLARYDRLKKEVPRLLAERFFLALGNSCRKKEKEKKESGEKRKRKKGEEKKLARRREKLC